jgi:hypothetical protein
MYNLSKATIQRTLAPTGAWSRTANQLRRLGGPPKTTLPAKPAGELGFAVDAVSHA